MRTPPSTLDGTLEATVSQSGYLAAITVAGNALRITSLDVDFAFDGYTWVSADLTIQSLAWDPTGHQAGAMVLGDSDLMWWSYALNLQLQDAPVALWACDAGAPDEAEAIWAGRIGAVARGDQQVTCALVVPTDIAQVPRRRTQTIVPSSLLAPPGTVITIGAQQYIIGRQFDQGRVPAPKITRKLHVRRPSHTRRG